MLDSYRNSSMSRGKASVPTIRELISVSILISNIRVLKQLRELTELLLIQLTDKDKALLNTNTISINQFRNQEKLLKRSRVNIELEEEE